MWQRIAGEIKSFSTDGFVAGKFARRMDKFMLYLLTAGKKAVLDAGLTEVEMEALDKSRCGVLIGSAMGGMQVLVQFLHLSFGPGDQVECIVEWNVCLLSIHKNLIWACMSLPGHCRFWCSNLC